MRRAVIGRGEDGEGEEGELDWKGWVEVGGGLGVNGMVVRYNSSGTGISRRMNRGIDQIDQETTVSSSFVYSHPPSLIQKQNSIQESSSRSHLHFPSSSGKPSSFPAHHRALLRLLPPPLRDPLIYPILSNSLQKVIPLKPLIDGSCARYGWRGKRGPGLGPWVDCGCRTLWLVLGVDRTGEGRRGGSSRESIIAAKVDRTRNADGTGLLFFPSSETLLQRAFTL